MRSQGDRTLLFDDSFTNMIVLTRSLSLERFARSEKWASGVILLPACSRHWLVLSIDWKGSAGIVRIPPLSIILPGKQREVGPSSHVQPVANSNKTSRWSKKAFLPASTTIFSKTQSYGECYPLIPRGEIQYIASCYNARLVTRVTEQASNLPLPSLMNLEYVIHTIRSHDPSIPIFLLPRHSACQLSCSRLCRELSQSLSRFSLGSPTLSSLQRNAFINQLS